MLFVASHVPVISASSYAGRLHTEPVGIANTTRRTSPAAISDSSRSIRAESAGPRNVIAPSIAALGGAPHAIKSTE
jgi:hypothetical protein